MVWNSESPSSALRFLRKRTLLRHSRARAMTPPAIMTGTPPRCMRHTTSPAPRKATPAVINQPPMTEMTPVTRNTALSRPQALSASEVPMATMNVTNVVESGSLSEVPTAMRMPASMRLTEPRTRSKAAPSSSCVMAEFMRRLTHALTPAGVWALTQAWALRAARTMARPRRELPNSSSPCDLELRPTVVCVT